MSSPSSMSSPAPVPASPASSSQGKPGPRESIGLYAVQCCQCQKWHTVPTKDEFETIRANFTEDPWFCSKRPDCSCEDPADIEYDSSRIWVMEKPDIPKPPPKTERLAIIRRDLTKMDICYILPNGKRAKGEVDVQKFLDMNPEYKDSLSVESFNFTLPKILEETVSHSSAWRTKKAKKRDRKNASGSSKNSLWHQIENCSCACLNDPTLKVVKSVYFSVMLLLLGSVVLI